MKYERTGLILCTEKYDECVAFYSDVLNLPISGEIYGGQWVISWTRMGICARYGKNRQTIYLR